jgi:transcriptional regulator with XRE-family HTH domain
MQSEIKIGQQLQRCRKTLKKGKTQAEVAADLGISRGYLIAIETDRNQPSYDLLVRLADYYDTTLDFLFGRDQASSRAEGDAEMLALMAEMSGRGRGELLAMARALHAFDQEAQRTVMLSNAIAALGGEGLLDWLQSELTARTARLGSAAAAMAELRALIEASMAAEEAAEEEQE